MFFSRVCKIRSLFCLEDPFMSRFVLYPSNCIFQWCAFDLFHIYLECNTARTCMLIARTVLSVGSYFPFVFAMKILPAQDGRHEAPCAADGEPVARGGGKVGRSSSPLVQDSVSFLFVVVVVVVVFTFTRIIDSVATGQASATLEWRNTPGKKTLSKTKSGIGMYQLTQLTPPSGKTQQVKSGVSLHLTRSILVHTSHYSTRKNDCTTCHLEKTTTYSLGLYIF